MPISSRPQQHRYYRPRAVADNSTSIVSGKPRRRHRPKWAHRYRMIEGNHDMRVGIAADHGGLQFEGGAARPAPRGPARRYDSKVGLSRAVRGSDPGGSRGRVHSLIEGGRGLSEAQRLAQNFASIMGFSGGGCEAPSKIGTDSNLCISTSAPLSALFDRRFTV
jgi:hypothetical protein